MVPPIAFAVKPQHGDARSASGTTRGAPTVRPADAGRRGPDDRVGRTTMEVSRVSRRTSLLSVGAAYGILVAVFEWGWGPPGCRSRAPRAGRPPPGSRAGNRSGRALAARDGPPLTWIYTALVSRGSHRVELPDDRRREADPAAISRVVALSNDSPQNRSKAAERMYSRVASAEGLVTRSVLAAHARCRP